jgi:hypothetical protein
MALTTVPADWKSRMTITVEQYAAIINIGRNTAYEVVRAGEVGIMRQRGRILVCVPPLLRQLGIEEQRSVETAPPRKERFRRSRRAPAGSQRRAA